MKSFAVPALLAVSVLVPTPSLAAPDKPIRALLVVGGCCHDYNTQRRIITEGVSARANVEWVVAYDPDKGTRHKNPVYENPEWAKGFDVIVHDECTSGVTDVPFIEQRVLKPHRDGLPAVILHCAEHSYRSEGFPKDTPWFQFTGVGSTGHGPQQPIEVSYVDTEHPITKGLSGWTTVNEELYNNVRLYDTAHVLARGKQKVKNRRGEERTDDAAVVWTNVYNGKTRVFATTLGHNNQTVADPRYLDLVTRGLLWAVDKLDDTHLKAAKPEAKVEVERPAVSANRQKIATSLKAPEGFDLTVFAAPPEVNYPTVVAAMPTGELFVGIDEMGSLGRKAGRGRVVRCTDRDGDGVADEFKTFATMDHPRGLIWDGAANTLYVQHPPFLSAYTDDDGDGVADRSEVLVKGTTNEKVQAQRGADHTTNGMRLGIDGWIYIAMGDFGCTKAVGRDGAELTLHAGGVVRVRTDGSGLEAYTAGQRNIYDVAIDPFMNAFTRDNTNDGDGWDVRLSYIVPTGNYGYPRLFKNFPDEIVKPMLELGGGSPCGSLYVKEPGLPGGAGDALFTVEWGRNAIMRHPLTAKGAGFETKEEKWMDLPRGTDMDVDAQGRFYLCSWANGGFDYSGPDVGYVVRLTPKNHNPTPVPDLKKAANDELVKRHLASPGAVLRLAAQREILRRRGPAFTATLKGLAESDAPLDVRAAAVFTLGQLRPGDLIDLAKRPDIREFVLRAVADRRDDSAAPVQAYVEALSDPNPRVRLVAAWAIGRFGAAQAAEALSQRVGDEDPLVVHAAANSLVRLRAYDACDKALDPSTPTLVPGAARVLAAMHETRVVELLERKLATQKDAAVRAAAYRALCRLALREADWDGGWWGTRPDTSGPYYKLAEWQGTEKVRQLLRAAMASESPELLRTLVVELKRNKIELPEAAPVVARLAAADPQFRQALLDLLISKQRLAPEDVSLLRPIALSAEESPELRGKALRLLAREDAALDAVVEALTSLIAAPRSSEVLTSALEDITREPRLARRTDYFAKLAGSDSPARRELAYTVLLNAAQSRNDRGPARGAARRAIDAAWAQPQTTVALLRAITRTRANGYSDKVAALRTDPRPEVAAAATAAARQLGLGRSSGPTVATLGVDKSVAEATRVKGDATKGAEWFTRLACANCHTVSPDQPPRGPFLGGIASRYSRAELCESILKPNAKIAQGFETQWFKPAGGKVIEGFVTRESGDDVELRNVQGETITLKMDAIDRRGKRDFSTMPEGLTADLTPQDLADLLAYLESLKGKQP